jgi:uncharacterized membrane protein YadS
LQVAVANVVLFGSLGLLVYPYLTHAFVADPHIIGPLLGLAIHDTSQVVGAALTYHQIYQSDLVVYLATVTKLSRNLLLAAAVPLLTAWNGPAALTPVATAASGGLWQTISRYVPLFVVGFVGASIIRSLGDASLLSSGHAFGVLSAVQWKQAVDVVGNTLGSHVLLGTAMAGVGLATNVGVLRGVGWRPFAVGGLATMTMGGLVYLIFVSLDD